MDSYGIKEAQMAGHSHSDYVNEYNDNVRSRNHQLTQQYQKNKQDLINKATSVGDRNVAMDAYHTLGAIHTGYEHYNMLKRYGGYKNALVQGTQHNIYNITQGKMGSIPMGPAETAARGPLERAALIGKGLSPELQARGTAAIKVAQASDEAGGFKSGLSAEDSLAQIKTKGPGTGSEGMSLESKVGKGIAKASGLSEGAAHGVGQIAGGIEAGALGLMTAYEDFSDGAKKFKSENKAQQVGDVAGMIGDAIGVASTIAPILAPLGVVASGVSAVSDWIGGKEADKAALANNASQQRGAMGTTISAKLRQQGSTATYTGSTSLQKVSGGTTSSF